jgi:hypothetical protein
MKSHTMRNVLIAVFVCLIAGGAVVVTVTYMANRSVSKEHKLKVVSQALSTSLENDEIDYGFHVVDGQVVFEGRSHPSGFLSKRVFTPVEGADAATFHTFDQVFPEHGPRLYYGADKNHVFVNGIGGLRKLGADPDSFRLLDQDGRFVCDKDSVYYRAIRIEGADPDSFRRLSGDFSVDKNHAYLGHVTLPADASTFEASSPGYISDPWHGGRYFDGPYSTEGWNRDANNIYFGNKIVDAADSVTFQDLKFAHYAKDVNNVYCEGKIIAGADPESFEILGTKYLNFFPSTVEHPSGHGPFARDKYHFYIYTDIDERDGPWLRKNDEEPSDTPH